MSDYIKREDAINAIERTWINGTSLCSADKAEEIIKSLPSADVVERKRGEWIWDKDGMDWNIGAWRCSECGSRNANIGCNGNENPMLWSGSRFCPNCGADMRKE